MQGQARNSGPNATKPAAALDRCGTIFPDTHNCKKPEGLSVVMQPDQVVQKTLVERLARRQLQPLDLVFDHQFAALQLDNM